MLDALEAIRNFVEGYARIKENCAVYAKGSEAFNVSQLYGKFSCAKRGQVSSVVVLDIEVSLRRDGKEADVEPGASPQSGSDRMDLLLLDTKRSLLRFFEAKLFGNKEIRAKSDRRPAIVGQLARYQAQLANTEVTAQMLAGYEAHVKVLNELLGLQPPLPKPLTLDLVPHLLVVGFDAEQERKLEREVKTLRDYGLSVHHVGGVRSTTAEKLFSGGRQRWL